MGTGRVRRPLLRHESVTIKAEAVPMESEVDFWSDSIYTNYVCTRNKDLLI